MPVDPQKARELFLHAVGKLPPEQWEGYVAETCGGDGELQQQVGLLLKVHREAGSFLDSPAAGPTVTLDPPELLEGPGTVIGSYKLLELIGEGGMGAVYMADQTKPVRRKVALKIIKPGMDTRQVIARFEAERQALAMMDHPNIARVLDAGATDSGRPYFVMELVRGISIIDYCDRNQLAIDDRLELFVRVCQAVQHAHQKGIIHRDLKPSNVMVTMIDGAAVPKVIDFGVVKAMGQQLTEKTLFTSFAQLIGTPLYMSPEQADYSGVDVDTRSDIYSLGVLLYELLTGTTPFDQETFRTAAYDEIRRIIREEEPPRPSTRISSLEATSTTVSANRQTDPRRLGQVVRGELDWIVMKAMEKDRNRRYETSNSLAADVRCYLDDEPVAACPPSAWYQFRKFARRNRAGLTMAGVVGLALVAGTAVSTWQAIRASKAERRVSAALSESRAQTITSEGLRRQAQDAAEQGRQRQVRLNVDQGTRLMNDGDLAGSLPFFIEALRLDSDDRARTADHRLRLGMLLAQSAKPSRVWFHDRSLSAVAFRPDGRAFAVALEDGTVVVRDVDTGEPLGPALMHPSKGHCLDFSPDGRRLATGGCDRTARVWDVATGREVFPRLEHQLPVAVVAFSPDGRLVLTGTRVGKPDDPTCRVWDAATGQPVTDWLPSDLAFYAFFSPDSRLIALPNYRVLQLYDARTGQPASPPMSHGHTVVLSAANCFSPDSRRIVTGCLDSLVRVWDTATGKQTVPAMKQTHWNGALFSPDGHWVLSWSAAGDDTARVWNAATGAPRCDPMRHPAPVRDAVFSTDGTRVATTCDDHAVRVWDARTGRLLLPPLWHLGVLLATRFSPDGRFVLTASDDRAVRLWDMASASPAGPRLRDLNTLFSAHYNPDGRLLVTRGMGGIARVWDAKTGSPTGPPLLSPSDWLSAGELSPDGRSFAALGGSEQRRADAWVWDLETRRVTAGPLVQQFGGTPVVAWSPDGRNLATAAGSNALASPVTSVIRVWDARSGRPVTPAIPYDAAVFGLDFSPDSRSLLTASGAPGEWERRGEARILDTATGTLRIPPISTPGCCKAARFSPDGNRLITGTERFAGLYSEVGEARIWDAGTGRPLTPAMPHSGPLNNAFFSRDGRLAVTVSDSLRVWDAATGTPVIPPIRSGPFVSASFSRDGRQLLAASWADALSATGFAQVFDVTTGWPLTPPLWCEGPGPRALFSPDGQRVVTTSGVGGSLLWDLKLDDRPMEDLLRTAEVLSASRIDAWGAAVPVATSELREAYDALLHKDPRAFTASREQLLGWHHQKALECEAAGAWDAAVEHLDRLFDDGPPVDYLAVHRGLAHAELGHWQEASKDLDIRKLTPQTYFDVWYRAALVHLGSGHRDGYRAACAGLLQHFSGAGASGQQAPFAAWTCALGPDALDDFGPALALAERLHSVQPKDPMVVQAFRALLYRAGRFAEALLRLIEAEQLPPDQRTSPVYGWFLLAMTHHRLGHADEARRWLDQATTACDKAVAEHDRGAKPRTWQRRLTLTLFRTEAKALLGEPELPADVFAWP